MWKKKCRLRYVLHKIDKGLVCRTYRETLQIGTKKPMWKMAEVEFTENYFLYAQGNMYKTYDSMSMNRRMSK